MKNASHPSVHRRISHLVVSALTGQARVSVTISVFLVIALVLLAYVSTQIYAGVLLGDIAHLRQDKSGYRELMNTLTSEHVALSSRERVTRYCENVLHMVGANRENLEHVAVKPGLESDRLLEFSELKPEFPEKFSATVLGIDVSGTSGK